MAMGAASAAKNVAPRMGRMIHRARAPAVVSAGQIASSAMTVAGREAQRVVHEIGELPGRHAAERVDSHRGRDAHRRGGQLGRARNLALLARLLEALRCRLFGAFLRRSLPWLSLPPAARRKSNPCAISCATPSCRGPMPASTTSRPTTSEIGKPDREQVERRRGAAHHAEREVDDEQRGDAGQRDRQSRRANSCPPHSTMVHRPSRPRPVGADRQAW